jgi:hypothetical protein
MTEHEAPPVAADEQDEQDGPLLGWYQRTVRAEADVWLARRKRHLHVNDRVRPVATYVTSTLDDFWRQLFGDKPGKVVAKLFPIGLTLYLGYFAGVGHGDLTKFAESVLQYLGLYIIGGIVAGVAVYFINESKQSEAWEKDLKSKIGRLEAAIAIWDRACDEHNGADLATKQWTLVELEQAVEAAKRGPVDNVKPEKAVEAAKRSPAA